MEAPEGGGALEPGHGDGDGDGDGQSLPPPLHASRVCV